MATMNISLPGAMRDYVEACVEAGQYASASDYVRDLIRRDQKGPGDEAGWLRDLDASIAESVAEMKAGGGVDLDAAVSAILLQEEDRTAMRR